MPIDTKRNNAPVETFSYHLLGDINITDTENGIKPKDEPNLITGNSLCLRPVYVNVGVIPQANGSAIIEIGETKVVAAVYGPRKSARVEDYQTRAKLTCDLRYAPFSGRQHKPFGVRSDEERDLSSQIQHSLSPAILLNKYPKSHIDIYVNVLQDDGGVLAAAITAANCAVVDCGVEMLDVVVATTAEIQGASIVLDPSLSGNFGDRADATLTLALMPSTEPPQITCYALDGGCDVTMIGDVIDVCTEACVALHKVVGDVVRAGYLKQDIGSSTNSDQLMET